SRMFFFFFQAEDGIRDFHVTGVQTCALPILPHQGAIAEHPERALRAQLSPLCCELKYHGHHAVQVALALSRHQTIELEDVLPVRSEERRVGKECRSRWTPEPEQEEAEDGEKE